jgi:hypothetical protein
MQVYISTDTQIFCTGATTRPSPVSTYYFTRRDVVPIQVRFISGGQVVELDATATGSIGMKASYAGDYLALQSSWTKTGTGTSTVYQFDLNLNTTGIDGLFPLDTEDSVSVKFEVSWAIGTTVASTLPASAVIYNDVIRDGGGAVTVAVPSGFRLASPNGTVWEVSADNDGLLQSSVSAATAGPSGLTLVNSSGTSYVLSVDNQGLLQTTQI